VPIPKKKKEKMDNYFFIENNEVRNFEARKKGHIFYP